MPTYGYLCNDCKHEFSAFQSMKDDPIALCPECKGTVKRLLYPVGVVFKGSGWYVNDSRAPEKSEGGEKSSETAGAADPKKETGTETKPEVKTETKTESKPETASAPTPVATASESKKS